MDRRARIKVRYVRLRSPAVLATIDPLEPRSYHSVTFGSPNFLAGVSPATGVAVGDLNGDGKPDVVVVGKDPATSNSVANVYINKGDGTFKSPTLLALYGGTGGVTLGDFRGNGKTDIATVDGGGTFIDVFLNDGAGNFTHAGGAPLPGSSNQTSIVAADFNGDGKLDLAVADPTDNQVQILYGKGNGSFATETPIAAPAPAKLLTADFNGDGHADLAVLTGGATPGVAVAINNGNGTFAAAVAYSPGDHFTALTDFALADLNGDGRPDLVAVGTQSGASVAAALLNAGDGTFAASGVSPVMSGASLVAAASFTGTGRADAAVISSGGGLSILPGSGDGTFQAAQTLFTTELGAPTAQGVAADFNGDGKVDLAYLTTSAGSAVLLNGATPTPTPGPSNSVLTPTITGSLPVTPLVAGGKIKPIHLKVVLTNTTGTAVTGNVTIDVNLSFASTSAAGDPVVGRVVLRGAKIKPGKAKSVSVTIKSLPAGASGSYYLVANVTDPSGGTASAASATTVNVVPAYVDLYGSFAPAPTTLPLGRKASLMIALGNAGTVPVNSRLRVRVYASSTGLVDANAVAIADTTTHIAIQAGKTGKLRIGKVLFQRAAGRYFLIAQLDPMNLLGDANLTNNSFVTLQAVSIG